MICKFLRRDQWEAKLRRLGASPLEGTGPLNTAEWWKGTDGCPFTVPVEADSSCEFWAIQRICQRLGDTTFGTLFDDYSTH